MGLRLGEESFRQSQWVLDADGRTRQASSWSGLGEYTLRTPPLGFTKARLYTVGGRSSYLVRIHAKSDSRRAGPGVYYDWTKPRAPRRWCAVRTGDSLEAQ